LQPLGRGGDHKADLVVDLQPDRVLAQVVKELDLVVLAVEGRDEAETPFLLILTTQPVISCPSKTVAAATGCCPLGWEVWVRNGRAPPVLIWVISTT